MESLLEVKNLKVSYHSYEGEIQSVRGISFTVDFGETIAIVGDAGMRKIRCSQKYPGADSETLR